MQIDYNLEGNPYRNLWAAVVSTALGDLQVKYDPAPKWNGGIQRQLDRRKAIWFFSCPDDSLLSWICFHLQIDLQATIKRAAEINPAVKKALSNDKIECYHKGTIKKAALKLYLQNQMGDCAIQLCGHAHWIGIVPPANILYFLDGQKGVKQNYLKGVTISGYIQPDQRWYACCGSSRKSRLDGYDDYAQEYEPTDLGFVKIVVEDRQIKTLERFLI
jgi:hypothetical protein